MVVRWRQRIYTPNLVVLNFGSWEMPKMGGPEKGGFQDHQNRAYFQDPEKTALFWRPKKTAPKKGPKNGRF